MKQFSFFTIIFFVLVLETHAQPANDRSLPHLEQQGTAMRLVVDGKPMLLVAGELHNSTSGGFDYMKGVWKKMAAKNLNTVIASASWELVEPEEGKFYFSLVDSVITGARAANLKLVLIWFASWKNGGSVYIPSWVKKNYQKYPRAKDEQGKPLEILTAFSETTAKADANAFAALMKHIKIFDGNNKTVVMMQVENEMGVLDNPGKTLGNARRDFSEVANASYNGPVPKGLIDYLSKHKDHLFPELYKVWSANGFKTNGSWEQVFGKSEIKAGENDWKFYSYFTEEIFSAWNYARYVEQVVQAGKKEYPIPMYVNAWLKQPFSFVPGKYPSGGPLPEVFDIWRAAAPSIDFFAPDIYTDEFSWICEEFTRSNNPLFIPEARGGELGAARAFYAIGNFNASCFSPFGIDDMAENDPLDECYAVLNNISSLILANQGMGKMKGIFVDSLHPVQHFELGDYSVDARLRDQKPFAGGLIIETGPDEFIVAGKALDIFFVPRNSSKRIGVDKTDEGIFEDGKWAPKRRLNGDEVHASTWDGTGAELPGNKVSIQKISLYSYQ